MVTDCSLWQGLDSLACRSMQGSAERHFTGAMKVHLDLRPTAGLRSLACLCIVVAHVTYYTGLAAADKLAAYSALTEHRWLTFALHISEPAMDTFLVLTG